MKIVLRLTCFVALLLTVVGCGKKVPVPEKTVIAAYIDLEKAYENGKDLADTFIDALPKEQRRKAKEDIEEALKKIDKARDALNPEWAVIAFGGDIPTLKDLRQPEKMRRLEMLRHPQKNIAVVIKVETDEETVKKWLKKELLDNEKIETSKKNGNVIFEIKGAEAKFALIDDTYLVFGYSEDAFDDMYDLYAGSGKPSEDFDDLAKISGDTICRISTASVSSLLRRLEAEREVEKFGEASEDKELADMILNMGSISLDIDAGDKVGLTLRVKCDSSSDAKLLESVAQSAAFFARIGCDTGAYLADNPDVLGKDESSPEIELLKDLKDEIIALARGIEADRSGSKVELSVLVEKDAIAKFIEKYSEYEEKKWKRFREKYDMDKPATSYQDSPYNRDRARDLIRDVDNALTRYYSRYDEYPDSLDDLTRKGWLQGGTYDPWGRELRYERMGSYRRPKVISAGPDRVFGTYDDISNTDYAMKEAAEKAKDAPKKDEAKKAY